jgi:hypothetical protein
MEEMRASDAGSIYRERLSRRQQSLKELLRQVRMARYARGGAGLFVAAILWLGLVLHVVPVWLALVPAAAVFVFDRKYEQFYAEMNRSNRSIDFYEHAIARIEDRWMGKGIIDSRFADSSHLYANDLDIFGKGSLFDLLCTARTRCGQETLARWFCEPASRGEILQRQAAVEELRNNIDLREDLAVSGAKAAEADFVDASEWALRPPFPNWTVPRIAAPILIALTLSMLAIWYWFNAGIFFLSIAAVAQLGFALLYRKPVSAVVSAMHAPAEELSLLHAGLARLERESFHSARLRELQVALQSSGKTASKQIRWFVGLTEMLRFQRDNSAGMITPLFLWSTQVAFAAETWRQRCGPRLQTWLNAVGEFEALCALAGYAFEHPECPFPEIVEGEARLEALDLRHPLLPRNASVANSISLGGGIQLLMVSGSNMSGKSTLLRTAGINLVLAQAGAPVCAQQLKCSPMIIAAAIRVQDSLQSGRSKFYAEIRRIKDIMTVAETGSAVLFLLDEILHGTNSHDRAIGAEAIIHSLLERHAIGLITTHDLALARVAESLSPRAVNVHFEDRLQEGEVLFDYRLRNGVIQKSNALELMRAVGLRV